jgi:hypothetical protein
MGGWMQARDELWEIVAPLLPPRQAAALDAGPTASGLPPRSSSSSVARAGWPVLRYRSAAGGAVRTRCVAARPALEPTLAGADGSVRGQPLRPAKATRLTFSRGLPGQYDRMGVVLSFGQDPRWGRALVAAIDPRPGQRMLDVATRNGARRVRARPWRVAAQPLRPARSGVTSPGTAPIGRDAERARGDRGARQRHRRVGASATPTDRRLSQGRCQAIRAAR